MYLKAVAVRISFQNDDDIYFRSLDINLMISLKYLPILMEHTKYNQSSFKSYLHHLNVLNIE